MIAFAISPDGEPALNTSNPDTFLGYPANHWLDTDFCENRIDPVDRSAVQKARSSGKNGHAGYSVVYTAVHADGTPRRISEIVERDSAGGPLSGILIDVTESGELTVGRTDRPDFASTTTETAVYCLRAVRKMSDYLHLLERHLSKQGDHVGSDLAVSLREGLGDLQSACSPRNISMP